MEPRAQKVRDTGISGPSAAPALMSCCWLLDDPVASVREGAEVDRNHRLLRRRCRGGRHERERDGDAHPVMSNVAVPRVEHR
jgi:hypothetical protein